MQNDSTVFVGLDVHKESIVAACSVGYGEVQDLGEVGVREYDWERLCRRLQSKAPRVVFVYEAGPCGYALQRFLIRKGHECKVCAPSLVPKKPGDRVKADRRDARKLVNELRAGNLSFVHVPDESDEAFRDLVRAWGAAKVSRIIQKRHAGLPTPIIDRAWDAQLRLCKRFRKLSARGKHHNVALVAVARELTGFIWDIARRVPIPTA